MSNYLLISDAAKEVKVESHVLRYWEEELHLPIKRNELGHRYYTTEDVERFKQIKSMKERGLQLKAIKMILKDGKLDVLPQEENGTVAASESSVSVPQESREEKAQRLQWILQQLIRQAVQENNQELVRDIKEGVLKELDYQFRMQEEREDERAKIVAERTEAYYQKVDELLRKKNRGRRVGNRDLKALEQKEKELTAKETIIPPEKPNKAKKQDKTKLQGKKKGRGKG